MSGITTGVGIFSGIDTKSLIDQLLAIEARPRQLATVRLQQLQLIQTSFLDLNTRINSIKDASAAFRTARTFQSTKGVSSDEDVLTATTSAGAARGTYRFIVDRLVSTQQLLGRGFNARDTGLGATSFTIESAQARLDRDVDLADLNGGAGITRGKIKIELDSGSSATLDLSRASNISEVLDEINASGLGITATADGGRLVLSGLEDFDVIDAAGYSGTAASLGIAGSSSGNTLTGANVYYASASTALASLNDGNGVYIDSFSTGTNRFDFAITIAGGQPGQAVVNVNIGDVYENVTDPDTNTTSLEVTDSAVTTLGGVVGRINAALTKAGQTDVSARISSDGARLEIVDIQGRTISVADRSGATAARDLGLATTSPATGTLSGKRVIAGLTTTLARNLNGGAGITGDGQIAIATRAGNPILIDVSSAETLDDVVELINNAAGNGGKIVASLGRSGTGLTITDTTAGSGNLVIAGTNGADSAAALGISTGASGVASNTFTGANTQHRYFSEATLLSSLNNGAGIGTGKVRFFDSSGVDAQLDVGSDSRTVGDLINEINSLGIDVRARINDNGDGLLIESTVANGIAIKVEDETGVIAKRLGIAGKAEGINAENFLNGSLERTIEFEATDSLDQIASKINQSSAGVSAAVINDGSGTAPFRISLTSAAAGRAGQFVIDTGDLDLGLTTIEEGNDSRVFFGSSDPAKGVLLQSSSNTIDGVIQGVSIDLKRASEDAVTLDVSRDNDAIVTQVNKFITSFNDAVARIGFLTRYDQESDSRGPLLGDSLAQQIRQSLLTYVQGNAIEPGGAYKNLSEVGIRVGEGAKLELDEAKFRAAMESDPDSVQRLLTARDSAGIQNEEEVSDGIIVVNPDAKETFTSLGVFTRIEELVKSYTDSIDGVLTNRKNALENQIKLQQDRIENFGVQLEAKRAKLEAQFLAMERAIASLQQQSSALTGLTQRQG
ncbi:MAG: flagellar filament capping protein FliD [Phycisphaerales bacterium]|jgi:flagellar hook-associated protein 2|nr:flagellar filament capping protein FliD [Phycisphaerales bacterium]